MSLAWLKRRGITSFIERVGHVHRLLASSNRGMRGGMRQGPNRGTLLGRNLIDAQVTGDQRAICRLNRQWVRQCARGRRIR